MERDTGILPNYNEPNIEIREIISPDKATVSIIVKDYGRFIDELLSIKEGGQKTFVKYGPGRQTEIKIINVNNQSVKRLGD